MSGNLIQLEKALRKIAKHSKSIKYTKGLLFAFLLMGMTAFSAEVTMKDKEIEQTKTEINDTVKDLKDQFRIARAENDRLLKNANIDLIQLMEQGDQVIKSPWSSWQFGINYYLDDWDNSYKGYGDKAEKYPYEGVYERSSDLSVRGLNPTSQAYAMYMLTNPTFSSKSAANAARLFSRYGLVGSNTPVTSPVPYDASGAITPKVISIQPLTLLPRNAVNPTLPTPISFTPSIPKIDIPAPAIPPVINVPGTGGGNGNAVGFFPVPNGEPNGNAFISQMNMMSGKIDASFNAPNTISYTLTNLDGTTGNNGLLPLAGAGAINLPGVGTSVSGSANSNSMQAIIKVVDNAYTKFGENLEVNLTNNTSGSSFAAQVLHYDEHYFGTHYTLDQMESAGFINSATKSELANKFLDTTLGHTTSNRDFQLVENFGTWNLRGFQVVGVNLQAHSGDDQEANSFFINRGTILGLNEASTTGVGRHVVFEFTEGNSSSKQEGFDNTGSIELRAPDSVGYNFYQVRSSGVGKHVIANSGDFKLYGSKNVGIYTSQGAALDRSEVRLYNPLTLLGDSTIGLDLTRNMLFSRFMLKFNIGTENPKQDVMIGANYENSGNISGNSELLTENSIGLLSRSGVNYTLNDYQIKIGEYAKGSVGIVHNNSAMSTLTLDGTALTPSLINIKGSEKGINNIGIYLTGSNSRIVTTQNTKINIEDSRVATGILSTDSSKIENNGVINITETLPGKNQAVKAIVVARGVGSTGGTVTNKGNITLVGGVYDDGTNKYGSVGLVAQDNGSITSTIGTINVSVYGVESVGLFAQNGTLDLQKANITTTGGAFNTFSTGTTGIIKLGLDSVLNTGNKSLAFYTDNGGKIEFTGPLAGVTGSVIANIAGSTNSNDRGTAFYYVSSTPYGSFDQTAVSAWNTSTFNGTLNNLTLNMATGSRLFIASDVGMNLSSTGVTGLFAAGTGPTINGTDYKTFMLYNSKLTIDQNVNLDNPLDAYSMLELASSSVTNNSTMTGSLNNQTAIAQEQGVASHQVNVINNGTINLSGNGSTGIYTKGSSAGTPHIENVATGNINVTDNSTAIYGLGNTTVTNSGNITMKTNSTGIYSSAKDPNTGVAVGTPSTIINAGNITSTDNNAVGIYLDTLTTSPSGTIIDNQSTGKISVTGDSSVGIYAIGSGAFGINNSGEIVLGNSSSLLNPSIGMYTDSSTNTITNDGKITSGSQSIGIYGYNINSTSNSDIAVGNKAIGIYDMGTSGLILNGKLSIGNTESIGAYVLNGGTITNNLTSFIIGNGSYGIISTGTGTTNITNNSSNVTIGDNSVFIYSSDTAGTITNNANLASASNKLYGLYGSGTIVNNNTIDYSAGIGNIGIYTNNGGNATNNSTITIGSSDASTSSYGIAMVADSGSTAKNSSTGIINVSGNRAVGMYASGIGSKAVNDGTINLNQSGTIGMYIEKDAEGINNGLITTTGSGTNTVTGVALKTGGKLTNNGTINIDTNNGSGILNSGGVIANYGTITVSGTDTVVERIPNSSTASAGGGSINISVAGLLTPTPGLVTITSSGVPVTPVTVTLPSTPMTPTGEETVAMYVDTSGQRYTSPMLSSSGTALATNLQIGTEVTKYTNAKAIKIDDPNIILPYSTTSWKEITSSSLTWVANRGFNAATGLLDAFYLAKLPYTDFASDTNVYNFADGLEQRYDMNALNSREKEVFNKLNGIGNNEEILLYQAYDEMMGHQYANTQQRLYTTSGLLNKEFDYLANEWVTASKQSNKVKVFGMKGEYNTDTAGIIDYKNDAYGIAYLHEDETIKLGANTGWYAGVVHNTFNFKDIGESKEETTIGKLGIFKTTTFDNNGSLKWKISGEGMLGYSEMKRRFLVVDEIFGARSTYTSYGLALRNELSKEIRLSERTSLKPYGSIDIEYGKYGNIKEKTGEVRLEVKGNDYYSVKPELGLEFKYKQPMFIRTNLTASIGIAYENELGKVNDADNKARVAYTNADYFNLRSEKENREGNVKGDLKLGIENSRVGFTFDLGYDTKGENVRGGLGLRVIY